MKIEQCQYFAEIARTGSISNAAKNLFISHQGLSDALAKLEEEIGFPLFKRGKRGVLLTQNGEVFYQQVLLFLQSYRDMICCAENLKEAYKSKSEKKTLMVNPILASVMIKAIIEYNLTDDFYVEEASIQESIPALESNTAALAIALIAKDNLSSFMHKLPEDIEMIELFDDEMVVCASNQSALKDYNGIDLSDPGISVVQYFSNYDNFFGIKNHPRPYVVSNDSAIHLKMMRDNNFVSVSTAKLKHVMFHDAADIIAIPFKEKKLCKVYLLRNRLFADSAIDNAVAEILKLIENLLHKET